MKGHLLPGTGERRYYWSAAHKWWLLPAETERLLFRQCLAARAPESAPTALLEYDKWVEVLQLLLNRCLDSYVNGAGSSWTRLLTCRPQQGLPRRLLSLARRLRHLVHEKLGVRRRIGAHAVQAPWPDQLVALYEELDEILQTNIPKVRPVVLAPRSPVSPWRIPAIRNIGTLFVREFGQDAPLLLVHGSVATEETVPYSDLDLLLLVRRRDLASPTVLRRLARVTIPATRCLMSFDPLQHHGLFCATEIDLTAYPETILPVGALAKSRVVVPEQFPSFTVARRMSRFSAVQKLLYTTLYLRGAYIQHLVPSSAYRLKGYLSTAMLLPALYAAAMGHPCFKGDSFEIARSDTPSDKWAIQNEMAAIRQAWSYELPTTGRVLSAVVKNPCLYRVLIQRYLSGSIGRWGHGALPSNMLARVLDLAEHFWSNVCAS